jgi:voltage-gated potassium channel
MSLAAEPEPAEPERAALTLRRRARRAILALAAGLVLYYAVPVGEAPSAVGVALSVVGLLGGMAVLVYLTIRQVRRLAGARPDDEGIRIESLIFLIYIVVPMFALGYFVLETADPGQFESLETKTDALYFTLSTLATVGFGDVHAEEQLARALVTLQIAFDLVFVGAMVSLLTGLVRSRATTRRAEREAAQSEPQP